MDFIFSPITADRLVVSTLGFAKHFYNFRNRWKQELKILVVWNQVEEGKTSLYKAYQGVIENWVFL
jgi:hypothetical protein